MLLKLNDGYSLLTVPYQKKVKLVVLNHGDEWVCRIETFKNLNDFVHSNNGQLFKGRLQLYKQQAEISIQVKGEIIGRLSALQFQSSLHQINPKLSTQSVTAIIGYS